MACYHWQIKMSKISISSFLIMHTIHLWSITIRLGFYNSIFLKSIYFLPNISFTVYFLYTMFFFLHLRCIILPAFNVSTLLIKFNLDFKFGLGFTLVSEFSRYQLSAQIHFSHRFCTNSFSLNYFTKNFVTTYSDFLEVSTLQP